MVDMLERIGSLLRGPNVGRKYDVYSKDYCHALAQDLSSMVVEPADLQEAAVALTDFLEQMLDTTGVEAVAFLSVHAPPAPITLSIEVLTRLRRGDKASTDTVRAVAKAKSALASRISSFLPSGLGFVNTAGTDLHALEQQLSKQWGSDPTLHPCSFVVFHRE